MDWKEFYIVKNTEHNHWIFLEYEKNSIKDPFFKYVNPNNIGNTLIYSDNALKMFLNTHISSNEEQLSDRLDSNKYVPKP